MWLLIFLIIAGVLSAFASIKGIKYFYRKYYLTSSRLEQEEYRDYLEILVAVTAFSALLVICSVVFLVSLLTM